jgi:hypothetical protein
MSTLQEALNYEAQEAILSIEDMMAEMLGNVEAGGGYTGPKFDEIKIRKMLLARNFLLKEEEKLKEMKAVVAADWDKRIKGKRNQVEVIDGLIDRYIREDNKGKTLSLDVATVSMKRKPHTVKVNDEMKFRLHLAEEGKLESFLKPATLDTTLAQNAILNDYKAKIEEKANKLIEAEKSETGKITKKREKEIFEQLMAEGLKEFKDSLPEGLEFIEPTQVMSIRSNIKMEG